jgi:KipI family sensor histidine kinase inhibitor
MVIELISDSSLLVRFADQPSLDASDRTLRFFYRLRRQFPDLGVFHPAYASVSIDIDPRKFDVDKIHRQIEKVFAESKRELTIAGDFVPVQVKYDGPDLDDVAKHLQLTTDEVVRLHSGVEYKVAFLGFSPGFPYLHGLPQRLIVPRLSSPRVRVPAGSVAIAGKQAGIYPNESPGGWRVLGHTDAELFDPRRVPATLFKPGDRVRFEPRPLLKNRAAKKSQAATVSAKEAAVEILKPGMLTSVQDMGRPHHVHLGISRGGAADPLAYKIGNGILGNPLSAAALEMTATGGTFKFLKDTWFAVTGSACDPKLDAHPVSQWAALPVKAGQTLECGAIEKMRSYLHIRGGFEVETVLGSQSTCVGGGWGGQILKAGDFLKAGALEESHLLYRPPALLLRRHYSEDLHTLRVTRGPQWEKFDDRSRSAFLDSTFAISNEVNRLGLRVEGPSVASRDPEELVSEGVSPGAIQVPASGQLLILFCEQCTTGGYPRIANVISADLWRLGQMKPGARFRFQEVGMEEAWQIRKDWETSLEKVGFGF